MGYKNSQERPDDGVDNTETRRS